MPALVNRRVGSESGTTDDEGTVMLQRVNIRSVAPRQLLTESVPVLFKVIQECGSHALCAPALSSLHICAHFVVIPENQRCGFPRAQQWVLEIRGCVECLHFQEPSLTQGQPATSEDLHNSHQASVTPRSFYSIQLDQNIQLGKRASKALQAALSAEANRRGEV